MRGAWLIAVRELRETVRDPNLVLPLVLMPCLIGVLAGISAFASFGSATSGVGTAVTNAALDQLPSAAVERLGTGQLLLGKLAASVIPAAAGTWLGVLVFWAMTLLSGSPLYPRCSWPTATGCFYSPW